MFKYADQVRCSLLASEEHLKGMADDSFYNLWPTCVLPLNVLRYWLSGEADKPQFVTSQQFLCPGAPFPRPVAKLTTTSFSGRSLRRNDL